VNAKTLKNLASKNSLYAGVEYEFIEILFRGSESIYSILDEISILRPLINSEENKR
jgi:hypothetical protein